MAAEGSRTPSHRGGSVLSESRFGTSSAAPFKALLRSSERALASGDAAVLSGAKLIVRAAIDALPTRQRPLPPAAIEVRRKLA